MFLKKCGEKNVLHYMLQTESFHYSACTENYLPNCIRYYLPFLLWIWAR